MAGTAGQVRPEGAGDDAMEILVCLAWFATGRFNPKLYPLVDHMTLYKHC